MLSNCRLPFSLNMKIVLATEKNSHLCNHSANLSRSHPKLPFNFGSSQFPRISPVETKSHFITEIDETTSIDQEPSAKFEDIITATMFSNIFLGLWLLVLGFVSSAYGHEQGVSHKWILRVESNQKWQLKNLTFLLILYFINHRRRYLVVLYF